MQVQWSFAPMVEDRTTELARTTLGLSISHDFARLNFPAMFIIFTVVDQDIQVKENQTTEEYFSLTATAFQFRDTGAAPSNID